MRILLLYLLPKKMFKLFLIGLTWSKKLESLHSLGPSDFGLDQVQKSFDLTDQYLWSQEEYTLPLKAKFSVEF
jgi:hypothetical protein